MSKAIRLSLTRSLDQVLLALHQAGSRVEGDFARWRGELETNPRPSPQLWALYHDTVQAALDQRVDEAVLLAAELLARDPSQLAPAGLVTTFTKSGLGEDLAR